MLSKVAVIGTFPPPIHGMAAMLVKLSNRLRPAFDVIEITTMSPCRRLRPLRYMLCFIEVIRVLFFQNGEAAIIALNDNNAILLDCVLVVVIRLLRKKVVLWHHSFRYVNQYDWRIALLVQLAGRRQFHVFLCSTMKIGFSTKYGERADLILSNTTLIDCPSRQPRSILEAKTSVLKIGYFSRVSRDKGIDRFLLIARRLRSEKFSFVAAGKINIRDGDFERALEQSDVAYRGETMEQDKWKYLSDLDLLLFPSRYISEAEPVAVIEAILLGVPVLATARGCLGTLLSTGLVAEEDLFVDEACRLLVSFVDDRSALTKLLEQQRRDIYCATEFGRLEFEKFVSMIKDAN